MDEKTTAALREVFEQKFAHMPLRRGELNTDSYWTPTTACAWEGFLACYQHLAPQWLPIETAPKDGTEVMLAKGDRVTQGQWVEERWPVASEYHGTTGEYLGQYETGECIEAHWMTFDGGFADDNQPTHWMPLPAAPDAAREQEKKTC